jgi:hypothetical protein
MKKAFFAVAVIIIAALLTGCHKGDDVNGKIFYGEKHKLGNGTVRSYVVLDWNKNPVSIGFNFTEKALSGLPTGDGMDNMLMLDLPAQAASSGYNHLEMDWNPNGHDPFPIYGLPHFDFHFYLVGMDELMQIVPGPDMTPVAPEFIPKDYISGVVAIPNMGVHWVDPLSPEFQGHTFTETFIYGFYKGEMLFVEPMATVAFFNTHPDVTLPVKQPQQFQKHAWYPTKYRIVYDQHQYYVSLEGLVKH